MKYTNLCAFFLQISIFYTTFAQNYRHMKKSIFLALCSFVLLSCSGDGRFLTSATGSIYECLLVCDDNVTSPVKETLAEYMYGLPQSEPSLTISHIAPSMFDDRLKATRNILQIDINPRQYTKVKASTAQNVWSKPQAYIRINAPSAEEFLAYWQENGETVREWFIREELSRQVRLYKGSKNDGAQDVLKRNRYKMSIPEEYLVIKDTTLILAKRKVGVLWCCDNKGPMRKDIMLYTYPYTSQEQFSNDSIIAMRDRVVKELVSAQVPGSYMATEVKYEPPVSRSVTALNDTIGGFYAVETRGLWKIQDGEAMGGPFVSLTRLDQVNGLVVHAEGFIFAPNQKKRSAIRKMEAILYSLKMPNER